MSQLTHLLGMNARNQVYCALNPVEAKRFGFSKIRSKEFLKKHGIGVAEVYAIIGTLEQMRNFEWKSLRGGFAIKPSNGSAGKGVLVIKEKSKRSGWWRGVDGKLYSAQDLQLHVSNILDGQFSTWGSRASAVIEERVPVHPELARYVAAGTPDVRVIVFNKIPVMAMARIPTVQSEGKANLDRGAIGLGLDMGTGRSMRGVSGKHEIIRRFPETNLPVSGVQIPGWTDVLKTAVRAANATGLVYMGCDVFLHPERGPLVAEVNAYPGLSIQIANKAGLRRRLRKVEDIEARNVNHAVRIGMALFGETYPALGFAEGEVPILSPLEEIEVFGDRNQKKAGTAVINTGKTWSVIAADAAKELGLADPNDVLWTQFEEGEGKALVVPVRVQIKDKVLETSAVVSKKLNSSKYLMHIGKRDLAGFLISGEQR